MKELNYSAIASRIKARRIALGYSYQELADKANMSKSTLQRYETGAIKNIPIARLKSLSSALEMDPNELIGIELNVLPPYKNVIPLPETYTVPLIGSIACGKPVLAVEEAEEVIEVPDGIKADFALRCKGDSMINARIFDGDVVYVRSQAAVDNGEIAAVCIDDEATLKRVRVFDDHVVLEPANPMYEPLVYWREDMNSVRILGKAVAFTSRVV